MVAILFQHINTGRQGDYDALHLNHKMVWTLVLKNQIMTCFHNYHNIHSFHNGKIDILLTSLPYINNAKKMHINLIISIDSTFTL